MTLNRKSIVAGIILVLTIITILVFIPAKFADNKENEAVQALSALYKDDFVVTKSTALKQLFSPNFELTVQSKISGIVYDFILEEGNFIGDYYSEQLNVEVAELVAREIDGFVMAKTDVQALPEKTSINGADISDVKLLLITQQELPESAMEKMVATLKETVGDVSIQADVLIVSEEEAYNGVTYEIKQFFKQSTVTKESFDGLKFDEQQFKF